MDKEKYLAFQEKCRQREYSVSAFYRDIADVVLSSEAAADRLFRLIRPHTPSSKPVSRKAPPLL
jgi:hypothetical protein